MGSKRRSPRSDDLANQLVEVVMNREPLTWAELAASVGEPIASHTLLEASRRRVFTRAAIVASPRGQTVPPGEALVFEADALPRVAASGRLWRLALDYARAKATHIHSASELKDAFRSTQLKTAFARAIKDALEARALPPGVGAVLRRGHFYLLRQEDVLASPLGAEPEPRAQPEPRPQTANRSPGEPRPPEASTPTSAPNDGTPVNGAPEPFDVAFEKAFDRLDAATGRRNFITLRSLRDALPQFPRAVFDRELNALRRAGRFSLDAAEGTHDRTTPEEREAGVVEAGRRLLYCARR